MRFRTLGTHGFITTLVLLACLTYLSSGYPPGLSRVAITLWTKGRYIRDLIATWVGDLPDRAVSIIVPTLDDIDCPPARELIPADRPFTTKLKALVYADWMKRHHLG